MHVLLCPGALSGSLPATMAVEVMSEGWRRRSPKDRPTCVPLSDGEEGLVDAVRFALGGELVATTVPGPLGRPVPATVLVVPPAAGAAAGPADSAPGRRGGGTAVIELNQVAGPHLVSPEERTVAALRGTSQGAGRLLRTAMGTGASRIVVGAGRSAAHDGGLGMLSALGLPSARLLGGGVGMADVEEEDLAGLSELRAELADYDVVVASATDEPLVGLHGAGAALVARAGLEPARAQDVERGAGGLARLLGARSAGGRSLPTAGSRGGAERSSRASLLGSRPYGGAGGGVALALAALGARLLDGAQTVAGLLGLADRVDAGSLLVTAAPELDVASLHSGVVATVAAVGLARAAPTVVLAGNVGVSGRELARAGIAGAYALHEPAGPFQARLPGTGDEMERVRQLCARLASTWSRP